MENDTIYWEIFPESMAKEISKSHIPWNKSNFVQRQTP